MARNLTYTGAAGLERNDALGMLASVGLFLLPAAMVSTPYNVLPFAVVLLVTSVVGVSSLWRARERAGTFGYLLLALAVAVLVSAVVSTWHFESAFRDEGYRTRFLAMPWALLWVCAFRPRLEALWWGALAGLFATLAVAGYQVVQGWPRAQAWTNSIVLADVSLVFMALLVFCRPPGRWGWIALGMAAGGGVILLSGSRGAWPALLALLLAMALSIRRGSGRLRLGALAGLVVVAAALVLAVPQLRERTRLSELHEDVQRIEVGDVDSSAGARLERLQVAWDTFLERPWAGVGIGHFDTAMQRLPDCRKPGAAEERCHLGHAHNDIAEWAATQGIPGLLLLLCVYGLPLWMFIHLHRRSGEGGFRGPAAAGVMVVVAYVLCGATQSMFAHQITASTYATLVGVLAGLSLVATPGRHRPHLAQD
jgi:O-antigen ligase